MLRGFGSDEENKNYLHHGTFLSKARIMAQTDISILARQVYSLINASDREKTMEQIGEALRKNYQSHNNELLKYHPKLELVFDPPEKESEMLRSRRCNRHRKYPDCTSKCPDREWRSAR